MTLSGCVPSLPASRKKPHTGSPTTRALGASVFMRAATWSRCRKTVSPPAEPPVKTICVAWFMPSDSSRSMPALSDAKPRKYIVWLGLPGTATGPATSPERDAPSP